jgi:hypothetical protein
MKTIAHEFGDTPALASTLSQRLQDFLCPLLVRLDQELDRRLVKTFAATIEVFLQQRYRASGLLLSELGAFLASPAHAPAGTKRLSNLLRSSKWSYLLLEEWLWKQAERRLMELVCHNEDALLLWDSSVLEKPESIALEGLCPVRSSEAARLKRIKKGFYTPPAGPPVFVSGMQWLCLLLLGRSGPPTLACMQWWTTRGDLAQQRRQVEDDLLLRAAHRFGRAVLHVFDRGFAGGPWLARLALLQARFVLRWNSAYKLQDWMGREKEVWRLPSGKRAWQQRLLWDAKHQEWRSTGVLAVPVRHSAYPGPLWLVVSRPGKGRSPWYLLTNEPVRTVEDAWRVVFAYARRWQIEMAFRFTKSELALESPRLWSWANRLKLLLMVSLAYAFLLSLLSPELKGFREALLNSFCPRTGKRSRETSTPLYRLRQAICFLFLSLRTPLLPSFQSSG